MSFSNRVASIATLTLTVAALIGFGTPGFAQEINRAINVQPAASVPQTLRMMPAIATTESADPAVSTPEISTERSDAAQQDGDTVAFGTLDAAVAAQPDTAMSDELQCMAGAIYFEAKGEPLSGQLAVAEVILNRSKSGLFPKGVCSVVTQPGQFSFVRGGHVPTIAPTKQYRTAVAVARVALADAWDSPASDAMYFHARRVAPSWHRVQVAAIGNHLFYR
jgi:spore germination cell wall hydrolase CwlJ-like protein